MARDNKLECDFDHDRPRTASVRVQIKSTRINRAGHPMIRELLLCSTHARELRNMGLELVTA